ncbi:MAG: pyrroline-5-carboxylate reductase [Bacteroidota bacterium]
MKIALIGCGNLGLSLLNGVLGNSAIKNEDIYITKRNLKAILHFEKDGIHVTSDNKKAIKNSELIVIAVKPYDVEKVLVDITPYLNAKKHIVISLATAVTIQEINKKIALDVPVFRAMPNTAADIKQSMTCISSNNANEEQIEKVKSFFNLIGNTIFIKEDLMEAATVLGACGIAYVLRFMRSMVQGGIQIGFDSKTATEIVNHVVKGAAELLIERKEHPEHEIDKVTTPKGCTIIGLNEMEHNGFSSSLIKGITASYKQIEK